MKNIYAQNFISPSSGIAGYWQRNLGALSPTNITDDLLLGTTATTTAQFSVSNIAKNQAIASLSGQFIVMPNNGWGGQVGIGITNPAYALDIAGSLKTTGNAYFKGPNPWIDVKAYGAKGDGVTNDTTAVQNAINAAGNGDSVFFPAGTYLVNALTVSRYIKIIGAGPQGTIIKAITGASSPLISYSSGSTTATPDVEGFTIDLTNAKPLTVWR